MKKGDRVVNRHYGLGTVVRVNDGSKYPYTVKYDNGPMLEAKRGALTPAQDAGDGQR